MNKHPLVAARGAASIPLVLRSQYDCAWCWRAMYPTTPFPVGVSSSICTTHANWLANQAGLHRQKKAQQAATKQEAR